MMDVKETDGPSRLDRQSNPAPGYVPQSDGVPRTEYPSSLEGLLLQSAESLRLSLTSQTLSSKESTDYISHLSSLSLSRLVKEPLELLSISKSLEADLSSLCFREFRTFLLAYDASVSIDRAFKDLGCSLGHILEDTSSLDGLSQQFRTTVDPILSDRKQLSIVLDHLNCIEDLLELPQLVSTCISARLWNEAIDLALKLRDLDAKMTSQSKQFSSVPNHKSSLRVLRRICDEVDRNLRILRDNCLNGLREKGLKLPLAVRTVGILRRMSAVFWQASHSRDLLNAPSEPELRMAFLASRWQCLTDSLQQLELSSGFSSTSSGLSSIVQPSPSQNDLFSETSQQLSEERTKFLRRWIEMWRELVGDAVAMYLDIFLTPISASLFRNVDKSINAACQGSTPSQSLSDPQTPFIFFIHESLEILFFTLRHHLGFVVSVSGLASLLTQLAYCGAAFGKWGMDFTSQIGPMIVGRLEEVVKLRMQIGLQQLRADLKPIVATTPSSSPFNRHGFQIRRRSLHPPLAETSRLEQFLISSDSLKQVLKLAPNDLSQSENTKLLANWISLFTPIARFINSQYTALNELRLLPAKALYPTTSASQIEVLTAATEEIRKIVHTVPGPGGRTSVERHVQAVDSSGGLHEDKNVEESDSTIINQSIILRLLLIWTRNVLPVLEKSLRGGVYGELEISQPDDRFKSLVNGCEELLGSFLAPPASSLAKESSPNPAVIRDGDASRITVSSEQEAPDNATPSDLSSLSTSATQP